MRVGRSELMGFFGRLVAVLTRSTLHVGGKSAS